MISKGFFVAPQNMELLRETRLMEIEKRLTDIYVHFVIKHLSYSILIERNCFKTPDIAF